MSIPTRELSYGEKIAAISDYLSEIRGVKVSYAQVQEELIDAKYERMMKMKGE